LFALGLGGGMGVPYVETHGFWLPYGVFSMASNAIYLPSDTINSSSKQEGYVTCHTLVI
jgi:hypothetical protein